MRIYIAGASGEQQFVKSLRSFYQIVPRPGDYKKEKISGRGDISRMLLAEEFYQDKSFDALAMFDLDMDHDPQILERLRTDMEVHNLDMVTGHYYSRNNTYIHSVCWDLGDGKWPFSPMMHPPRTGIHEIGITGMGCVLIKREVYEAVQNHLPMGDRPFAIGPAPEVTGDSRTLGTDFRFFSLARLLGYRLWLDVEIESTHATLFWVDREIAEKFSEHAMSFEYLHAISEQIREADGMDKKYLEARVMALESRLKELKDKQKKAQDEADMYQRQFEAVGVVLSEDKFLIEQMSKGEAFPRAPEEDKQKLLDNRTKLEGVSKEEAKAARNHVLNKEAEEFVGNIQSVKRMEEEQGSPV